MKSKRKRGAEASVPSSRLLKDSRSGTSYNKYRPTFSRRTLRIDSFLPMFFAMGFLSGRCSAAFTSLAFLANDRDAAGLTDNCCLYKKVGYNAYFASVRSHKNQLWRFMDLQEHESVDDDDISQHEFAAPSSDNNKDESVDDDDISQHEYMQNDTEPSKKGYRRIEDWHTDHIAENPEGAQVLAHLKREKAKWAKTFGSDDSLGRGGEGI